MERKNYLVVETTISNGFSYPKVLDECSSKQEAASIMESAWLDKYIGVCTGISRNETSICGYTGLNEMVYIDVVSMEDIYGELTSIIKESSAASTMRIVHIGDDGCSHNFDVPVLNMGKKAWHGTFDTPLEGFPYYGIMRAYVRPVDFDEPDEDEMIEVVLTLEDDEDKSLDYTDSLENMTSQVFYEVYHLAVIIKGQNDVIEAVNRLNAAHRHSTDK